MTYEQLIKTVSEIINNPNINSEGIGLTYELIGNIHEKINREIFYTMNSMNIIFTPIDIFEVEIGGILVKFIKK